jgi:hypothetical protein
LGLKLDPVQVQVLQLEKELLILTLQSAHLLNTDQDANSTFQTIAYAKNGSFLDTKPQTAKFESHEESMTEVKNARILNKGIRRGDRSRKR